MYHSITIGEKNTWDDWHLIPASRPLFNPPPVKTNYVEIPGGDGVLDLTDALAGRPVFGNRTGSWTFFVENGFMDWSRLYSEIMCYLHGKTMKATLEDDPAYFYEGRFCVNQWKSDQQWSQIVIDYNVFPYKMADSSDWLWDPFSFETGVIREYKNLSVNGSLSVIVSIEMMDSVPEITCSSSGMSVRFNGSVYELEAGRNVIDDIILKQGDNTLVFSGNGTISVEHMGGRL